ncbi:hypothetical protein AVEN_173977-1 [Araneus ventricosus]|uniref:Uncharacterized protein n=1 Tax=Araneus ventricosus TaxID=182803 RepID=A0A4Y2K0U1_ARAVE|nr:hypothetical protein AVEN_173977-1 [Araneus ventricosus]
MSQRSPGRECSIHMTFMCGRRRTHMQQEPVEDPGTIYSKCMDRHRRRLPRRALLVARTSDRSKLSYLPSASIVGRRARISSYAFLHVVSA